MDRDAAKRADDGSPEQPPRTGAPTEEGHRPEDAQGDGNETESPNPPRTTTGKVTAPKFGSATSGGGELEPGPPRD